MTDDPTSRNGNRRSDRHGKPVVPAKRSRRAAPSRIDRVNPRTESSETARQSQKRRKASGRIVTPEARKRRQRRRLAIVATVVAVVVLGGAVAAYAWVNSLQDSIGGIMKTDPSIAGLLPPAPPAGDPFYLLIMGVDTRPGEKLQRSDTLVLAYIDPKRKRITTMSIPRDTRVSISGRGEAKINEAMELGGPKKVIETVKKFTGLPITHFVYLNFEGFKDIVDSVGGVDVYVPENIQDLQAAGGHRAYWRVYKGNQHLDGGHALTFVRARHQFADQDFSRMKNQQTFLKALAKRALAVRNPATFVGLANSVSKSVNTDMKLSTIVGLAQNFQGMDQRNLQSVTMPGVAKYIDGVSYVVPDMDEFRVLVAKMKRGEMFTQVAATSTTTSPTVTPSKITLNVRNGTGASGKAKLVADKLAKDGFKIKDTGNMNQNVYGTTLIVFRGDADTAKAAAVQEALGGVGRVIRSQNRYVFDADIMVIVGMDFDPTKFGISTTVHR